MVPPGLTPDFAAPEVLRSFFKSFGNARCPNRKVDGPAADMYSVGTAMFEMLTGSTPFPCRKTNYPQIKVPKEIPQRSEELWQMAAAVQKLQTSWVSSNFSAPYTLVCTCCTAKQNVCCESADILISISWGNMRHAASQIPVSTASCFAVRCTKCCLESIVHQAQCCYQCQVHCVCCR